VLGATVEALPRTGGDIGTSMLIGGILLAMGAMLVVSAGVGRTVVARREDEEPAAS
jgi:LPXTG-motif cell wall-anchored protein